MPKLFLSIIAPLFRRRQVARQHCECWARDPLDHPDIAAMDPRQLADLPANELRARVCC